MRGLGGFILALWMVVVVNFWWSTIQAREFQLSEYGAAQKVMVTLDPPRTISIDGENVTVTAIAGSLDYTMTLGEFRATPLWMNTAVVQKLGPFPIASGDYEFRGVDAAFTFESPMGVRVLGRPWGTALVWDAIWVTLAFGIAWVVGWIIIAKVFPSSKCPDPAPSVSEASHRPNSRRSR